MSKINSIALKKDVLSLYKKVLTLHYKKLNEEMRLFGDFFVKTEFRMNYTNCDDNQINIFLNQWRRYYNDLNVSQIHNIKVDEGLKTRMDIDQMKSLNEIKTIIDDNSLKKSK